MRALLQATMVLALMAIPRLVGAGNHLVADPGGPAEWTLSGHVGISTGSQTPASFSWRGGIHRRVSNAASLGLEAGRHRWEGGEPKGYGVEFLGPVVPSDPFRGLAKGGNELQHVSLALRLHAPGIGPHGSAPVLAVGAGLYRQVVRHTTYASVSDDPRHNKARVGVSMALGGAATRGIAPGAEIRFEHVATQPSSSSYFTVSVALLANR